MELRKNVTSIEQFAQQNQIHMEQPLLLVQALTHRSFVNEHENASTGDNERLEFLGDAVIGFLAGEWLFNRYPGMLEGDLTRLRAALVQRESLAALARQARLGEALRMGKGEEANGGRDRDTILCDAFEAVVGALFLDQGMDATRAFVLPRLEKRLETVLSAQSDKDARSLLQEWSQSAYSLIPQYAIVEATGPDHEKVFTVEVTIGAKVAGRGEGRSKQVAAQAAAREALISIERGFVP
ncbi:MAG: ribonuclease III [bacterium]|nr:ribonuclease III [bacterium]